MNIEKRPPKEKTGWYLVLVAAGLMIVWIAAIPFIRHSGFIFGLWRGLGFAPLVAGASGANFIAAARKARTAAQDTKATSISG